MPAARAKPKPYAHGTKVDVESSRAEVERTIKRHGGTGFTYREDDEQGAAYIVFALGGKVVRFLVELPGDRNKEAEIRRRWRVLAMKVKMKFESVASELSTIDEEFMSYYVATDGRTMAEHVRDDRDGAMSRLFLAPQRAHLALPAS